MKVIIEKPSEEKLAELQVKTWPIWQKEESEFDWYYDKEEICYIIAGEVIVETEDETYHLKVGDLVTFPQGLQCVWKVKKAVKKHYKFL